MCGLMTNSENHYAREYLLFDIWHESIYKLVQKDQYKELGDYPVQNEFEISESSLIQTFP